MNNEPLGVFSYLKSDFSCMSAKFSPFDGNRIAITACDNFGVVGKGKLMICDFAPQQQMKVLSVLQENDAIFDCSWHEADPNLILLATGTGEYIVCDISGKVVFRQKLHPGEMQSIECSHKQPNLFLTSGVDGTTRLCDLTTQKQLSVFQTHKGSTYQSIWHPVEGSMFATAGADGALRLWDLNSKQNKNIASIKAHQGEVLSCDFNKYEDHIATSSTDKNIHIWDLKNMKMPINQFAGHRYPVKRVKYSPHDGQILASASYDMSVIIWDSTNLTGQFIKMHQSHTEFVVSVDFNLHIPKQIASASWDGKCYVWQWDQKQPQIQ